jgi:hypothetical protein
MSIFSRGGNVLDLPEMQRKGLVKFPEKEEVDEIDFTLKNDKSSEEQIEKKESSVSDFFGNFSAIGVSNDIKDKIESVNEIKKESNSYDLKWRLENTEYKIEQILERLIALEKKLI